IDAGTLQAGYSTISENRASLSAFRQSGKWVGAYADASSQGAYYAASAADKIYLNPSGMIDLHGLSVETMYVKELYEKLGIHFQIIKVGKYKSATETYSETAMSDANREQVTAFVTGIWRNVADSIAAGRGITRAQVNALADRFTAFVSPEELVKGGLADSLAYGDGVKHELKRRLGIRETDDLNLLSVSDMRSIDGAHNIIKATRSKRGDGAHNIIKATRSKRGDEPAKRGKQIAVYYAEGTIIDSETEAVPSFGGAQIAGDKVCRDLERLMDADDVSAVVLRVNSPGGSAHAAEQIWHYLARLKEKKPVVVSMGDYAASGGYYISCNASYIVAEPTTITGSIGIYGIIPEASELLTDKLGLHFDGVKTNEHADFGAGIFSYALRPFTADEREIVQKYIDRGYALFRRRVADGRSESIDEVERIAQGHVWTGQDALKSGLSTVSERLTTLSAKRRN
ncbi:MAG: signal peptide peptidase SppA, partial [Prevotella sp.]|nr:signal peptide peptidase SppA [Prevotella sp.]